MASAIASPYLMGVRQGCLEQKQLLHDRIAQVEIYLLLVETFLSTVRYGLDV